MIEFDKVSKKSGILTKTAIIAFFILFVFFPPFQKAVLHFFFPEEGSLIYPRYGLPVMFFQHLLVVIISSSAATAIAVLLGIFATREAGKEFLPIIQDFTSFTQTFPPAAVLALAVPILGFGYEPTIAALFFFSLLPVVKNTISGIQSINPTIIESARGMGMNRLQLLTYIELPLSVSVIMAGIRTSVIINIGTATIGAVAGAGGLGAPIISGLIRDNQSYVLQGAIATALFALTTDWALQWAESKITNKNAAC